MSKFSKSKNIKISKGHTFQRCKQKSSNKGAEKMIDNLSGRFINKGKKKLKKKCEN